MRNLGLLAASAAASIGAGLERIGMLHAHRIYGDANIRAMIQQTRKRGKKLINRSRYMPHQGPREIARRQRQAAKLAAKRAAQP